MSRERVPSGSAYSLVEAQRKRQQSSPDSDPRELRKQILETRLRQIEERQERYEAQTEARQEKIEAQIAAVAASVAEIRDTVIQAKATFRAWLVAASAFWALLVMLAGVLVKVL